MAARSMHIIGNPGNRRVAHFQSALAALGWPPARVVSYHDLLTGTRHLADELSPGALVRIESPGEDFEVERLLLRAGFEAAQAEGSPATGPAALDRLTFDPGRILYPRQWYLGYRAALARVAGQLSQAAPHWLFSAPMGIEVLFDKPHCQKSLAQAGVPVPPFWPVPKCYADVREQLRLIGCRRAFVKLAHGSSASGVVALYVDRRGARAATSAELVREQGETRLYNSLNIRAYTHERDVAELIDELCLHRVQFEEWLPKAALGQVAFDLRVLVIAGRARHAVVRTSRTPMTNLHLGNERGNLAMLTSRMGPERRQAALDVCERAAAAFAGCWQVGIDLLLQPGFRRPTVIEANAFGDLLPGVYDRGEDTYMAELTALDGQLPVAAPSPQVAV
jgi:hypothetical protein